MMEKEHSFSHSFFTIARYLVGKPPVRVLRKKGEVSRIGDLSDEKIILKNLYAPHNASPSAFHRLHT